MTVAAPVKFAAPQEALDALLAHLRPVDSEIINSDAAAGRILAEPLRSDRPSPPCDVSAMDGYALRLADLTRSRIPVAGEIPIGRQAPPLPPGAALRIVTGAAVPEGAQAVIRREDVVEGPDWIKPSSAATAAKAVDNIRRRGENLPAGGVVAEAGRVLSAPVMGALAAFGSSRVTVHRKVRVGILVTGDELLDIDARPQDWQIRDSNGPALRSLLAGSPWIEVAEFARSADDPAELARKLAGLLARCDAVVLTGGVSMGDRDYVPRTVADCGGRIIFHKLPIRPGKPILGAVGPAGQAILGLPGNPVSVLTCAARFLGPALRNLAGFARPADPPPHVSLAGADDSTIKLWWYRLVRLAGPGLAELVPGRGSGDIVSAARSDGFIEVPPGAGGAGGTGCAGPWPFYRWEL